MTMTTKKKKANEALSKFGLGLAGASVDENDMGWFSIDLRGAATYNPQRVGRLLMNIFEVHSAVLNGILIT